MKLFSDYIRVSQMTMQTWTACLQTISLRTELMSTHSPLSTKVIRENMMMSTEKISASFEIYSQLHRSTFELYHGKFDPLNTWVQVLVPIREKAANNAQRLSRQSRKS